MFDPFLAYFVFGYPFLALAVAGVEIMEYVVFETFGHYVFFLNDSVGEEMWDVLILDIGGTLVGTLIAANLNFYLEGQFIPKRLSGKETVDRRPVYLRCFFSVQLSPCH